MAPAPYERRTSGVAVRRAGLAAQPGHGDDGEAFDWDVEGDEDWVGQLFHVLPALGEAVAGAPARTVILEDGTPARSVASPAEVDRVAPAVRALFDADDRPMRVAQARALGADAIGSGRDVVVVAATGCGKSRAASSDAAHAAAALAPLPSPPRLANGPRTRTEATIASARRTHVRPHRAVRSDQARPDQIRPDQSKPG